MTFSISITKLYMYLQYVPIHFPKLICGGNTYVMYTSEHHTLTNIIMFHCLKGSA